MRICSQCMSVVSTSAAVCPHDGGSTTPVPSLPAGTKVGDYTIVGLLGEGGMGYVYEAKHEVLNRRAAMKFLRTEFAQNHDVVTRFLQEAKAVNVISHDNIVNIYDYGEIGAPGEAVVYFVMEFMDGADLQALIDERKRLSTELLLRIFEQIARALVAAHDKKIVHRDLKPENVFLTKRDTNEHFVKLLDFGIAQLRGDGQVDGLTRQGTVMGTPQYMSPEQVQGQTVDARTDIYTMGVMLYYAATGALPFDGQTFSALAVQIISTEATPPRKAAPDAHISPALEAIIVKAMKKQPADRYGTMAELLDALVALKKAEGLVAPDEMPRAGGTAVAHSATPTVTAAPSKSSAWKFAVAGAVVVALGVGGMMAFGGGSKEAAPAAKPAPAAQTPPAAAKGSLGDLYAAGDMSAVRARATEELREDLNGDDADAKQQAVAGLALAGSPRGAALLYEALNGSPHIKVAAAEALRDLGYPDAAPKIRAALGTAGAKLKVDLAACMLVLGDKDGVAILEQALTGPPAGQLTAAVALARAGHGDKAKIVLADAMSAGPVGRARWREAAHGLIALGDATAKKALAAELAQPDAARAVAAADILAGTDDADALGYLQRVVADPAFPARGAAALALASRGDSGALDFVADGLGSDDPMARKHAIAVAARLANQGGKKHAAAVVAIATDDTDRSVRAAARAGLLAF